MSTLLITASTSVRASHSGLPVSRAIRSAKGSSLLADDVGEAAQRLDPEGERLAPPSPARPARAAATAASAIARRAASTLGAGGGFDRGQGLGHRPSHAAASVGCFQAASAACQRLAHPPHRGDLGVERRPVVAPRRSATRSPRPPRYASSRGRRPTNRHGRARRHGVAAGDQPAEVGEASSS